MNQKLRTTFLIVLILIFLSSLSIIIYKSLQRNQSKKTYAEAETIARSSTDLPPDEEDTEASDDPYLDVLKATNLASLRELNEDVIGWILIPGTNVDYPLMYSGDNEFYLRRTWDKESNTAGSIFLEQYCNPDFSDFNTILYGHRMRNGTMFASLQYYSEQEFWKEHPYIYIYNLAGAHRYEVFAAYEVSVTGTTYRLYINDDETKQTFLDDCTGWSVIDTGVTPTIQDHILTLSTCTGNGYKTRWVVQARLDTSVN